MNLEIICNNYYTFIETERLCREIILIETEVYQLLRLHASLKPIQHNLNWSRKCKRL